MFVPKIGCRRTTRASRCAAQSPRLARRPVLNIKFLVVACERNGRTRTLRRGKRHPSAGRAHDRATGPEQCGIQVFLRIRQPLEGIRRGISGNEVTVLVTGAGDATTKTAKVASRISPFEVQRPSLSPYEPRRADGYQRGCISHPLCSQPKIAASKPPHHDRHRAVFFCYHFREVEDPISAGLPAHARSDCQCASVSRPKENHQLRSQKRLFITASSAHAFDPGLRLVFQTQKDRAGLPPE